MRRPVMRPPTEEERQEWDAGWKEVERLLDAGESAQALTAARDLAKRLGGGGPYFPLIPLHGVLKRLMSLVEKEEPNVRSE